MKVGDDLDPRIIFLVYRDGLGPVFGSLYAKPAELLGRKGLDAGLISFAPIGEYFRPALNRRWKARVAEFGPGLNGRLSRWPVTPARLSGYVDDSWPMVAWLLASGIASRRTILHCGGSQAAYFALRARDRLNARQVKVVFHSWGPTGEEFAYGLTGDENGILDEEQSRYRDMLTQQETFAYRNANVTICPAEPMRDFARKELGVDESRLVKIPCYVDAAQFSAQIERREALRREFGFDGRTVFVYSGALHVWQKPEAIFDLFQSLKQRIENALFLILTPHVERALACAQRSRLDADCVQVRMVSFSEVPSYLAASDIGILARGLFEQETKVNLFSSPIKIPEYLAAGCPVVLGQGIGDMSDLISVNELGVTAGANDTLDELAETIVGYLAKYSTQQDAIRRRCVQFAQQSLDINSNIQKYIDVYRSLSF